MARIKITKTTIASTYQLKAAEAAHEALCHRLKGNDYATTYYANMAAELSKAARILMQIQ